ncbi:MAG: formate dehydrogenase accessory sulfurtransferase FdhD, partial [candidate division NC10 bacterium]|nr:formate dehydrogenase accessory sulfurtransferase FdhD [candidate division NC10 bacterium]
MSARGGGGRVVDWLEEVVREVGPVRVFTSGVAHREQRDQVVVEEPLTIEMGEIGSYTLMHTPTDPLVLALGFAFSEGLIRSLSEVNHLHYHPQDPGVIRMEIKRPAAPARQRNLAPVSLCGPSASPEALLFSLPRVGNSLRLLPSTVHGAMEA